MPTYRPSCVVRLTLRLEEFDDTSRLNSLLPMPDFETVVPDPFFELPPRATTSARDDSATGELERNQERITALRRRRDDLSREQFNSQLAALVEERQDILTRASQVQESGSPSPPSVTATPPDDLTVIGNIEPSSVTIERNGLSTADTASIVIDYNDAPIDPRIIRAAHVEIILGVVNAENFEAGIERGELRSDGSLSSIVGRDESGVTTFYGFVDSWSDSYAENSDTITMECRDMSAPIRDIKLNTGDSIDLSLPINQGIFAFLNNLSPTTRGIAVIYAGEGDAPTPGNTAPRRRRPRRGRVSRRARRGGEQMSAWDHITDVVRGLGLIPTMIDNELHLIEPRTLYSGEANRRMVFGRNLSTLEFKRNLQGVKVPTIEIRSYDPERGRTIWARHPVGSGQRTSGIVGIDPFPSAGRANNVPPSGATPDDSIRVMSVSGVTDQDMLVRIARNIFESIGRQEIEGTFSTEDVWSYDRLVNEADLLQLNAGDPIELLIAQHEERRDDEFTGTSLARLQSMAQSRRRDYLVSLGWDIRVADRFSRLQQATGFQTTFRVRNVRISWDIESGLKLDVDFINYVVVRELSE